MLRVIGYGEATLCALSVTSKEITTPRSVWIAGVSSTSKTGLAYLRCECYV